MMNDLSNVLAGRTIVQIVPELDTGGVERTTVDVAAALAAAGARPLVLSEGGRLVAELGLAGGIFRAFPAATKNPLRILANARRLSAILRQEKAAILHARSRAPAWSALMAARSTATPFITTWAGTYSAGSAPKRLYNSVMARGDVVIANSAWTGNRILRDHPQAASRLTVIPRGTDFALFDPARITPQEREACRAQWGVTPAQRIVLVAARLTAWKGQMVVIDALARLGTEVVAVFAGDAQGRTDYVSALKTRAANLGVEGRVIFAGHTPAIATAIAASDVIAVASTGPEAFGRAAVEAQAMQVPVIVTDHGAPTETVMTPPQVASESRTGWRVPPGDSVALADAIREVLGLTPDQRTALGLRAREHAAAQFSLRSMTDATLAVYARIIGGG